MEKEFVDYWNTHQNHLILNAPEGLRKEYFDSSRLDTPIDWICFLIPIAVGILLQTFMGIASTIVSMGITIVVVVLLYALMQMVKPYLSQKKSEAEAVERIKMYYYERYKKSHSLEKLEPWRD